MEETCFQVIVYTDLPEFVRKYLHSLDYVRRNDSFERLYIESLEYYKEEDEEGLQTVEYLINELGVDIDKDNILLEISW